MNHEDDSSMFNAITDGQYGMAEKMAGTDMYQAQVDSVQAHTQLMLAHEESVVSKNRLRDQICATLTVSFFVGLMVLVPVIVHLWFWAIP